jgi:hypothetical protein
VAGRDIGHPGQCQQAGRAAGRVARPRPPPGDPTPGIAPRPHRPGGTCAAGGGGPPAGRPTPPAAGGDHSTHTSGPVGRGPA